MTQERKNANKARAQSAPPKKTAQAYYAFTGTNHSTHRELAGNYPRQTTVHPKTKKPIFNYNKTERNRARLFRHMTPQNMPVLYKGFKGRNAENLRTKGYFNAKTLTSTSKSYNQAYLFAHPGGIVITMPPKRRTGISNLKSTRPREQEVTLAPQRFELKNYKYENFKK